MESVKKFIVLTSTGKINHEATINNFIVALDNYESLTDFSTELIALTVEKFFNKQFGKHVTGLESFIVGLLKPTPDNHKYLIEKVKSWIKENTGEYNESILGMRKGIGGGHWRWSDKATNSKEVKTSLEIIAKRSQRSPGDTI